MSRKRREGGGGGRGAGPGDHHDGGTGSGADAVSMDGGLREVSVSVVFSVWCLLFLLRSQFLHSQTDGPSGSLSLIIDLLIMLIDQSISLSRIEIPRIWMLLLTSRSDPDRWWTQISTRSTAGATATAR